MEAPRAVLRWTPARATDLVLTLGRAQQGRSDPVQQRTRDGAVWRTVRTPGGPATVRFAAVDGGLEATGWGPGAEEAVGRAPRLLGEDDDATGFRPGHPFLVAAHHRFPGLRIAGTGDVLHGLVGAILEQRVEGVEALAAWNRIITDHGAKAPGPAPDGMRVLPDGTVWSRIDSWEWRRAGVDVRRAETVRRVAQLDTSLQRLTGRPMDEVQRALTSIRGVGTWTAAEVRQRALGDPDAVSVGDYHLAGIVGQTLAGRPFTDSELVPFLEPWRGHRYRVARLIYASGIESLPRRGPRPPR